MNLANKLTVFRMILVPVLVIIPFLNLPGEWLGISTAFWVMDAIFILAFSKIEDGAMVFEHAVSTGTYNIILIPADDEESIEKVMIIYSPASV